MLQRIILCVGLCLGLTLNARAAEKQQLELTGSRDVHYNRQ